MLIFVEIKYCQESGHPSKKKIKIRHCTPQMDRKKKRKQRFWTNERLQKRNKYNCENLLSEFRVKKQNTIMPELISASQRLSLTLLRNLATGYTFEDLSASIKIKYF
ncbi:uncharacterized protein LOC112686985 [Sipha flava]|uniref:Uncharacterized protein LOC112686985 n=1 Tax=Sipha flava TaxID=143950 RepID=A0A8B8FXM5_9HEMI|nr:uncharacterized protein LOC112686985 [Sipha flava]